VTEFFRACFVFAKYPYDVGIMSPGQSTKTNNSGRGKLEKEAEKKERTTGKAVAVVNLIYGGVEESCLSLEPSL
jgi:hypothetical protein